MNDMGAMNVLTPTDPFGPKWRNERLLGVAQEIERGKAALAAVEAEVNEQIAAGNEKRQKIATGIVRLQGAQIVLMEMGARLPEAAVEVVENSETKENADG